MYLPDHFRESDPARIKEFLHEVAIAELISWNGSALEASTLPLILRTDESGTSRLLGHFARANPQWQSLSPETAILAIFRGPDSYISPSSYPSKKENGRVVPTWNYASVHIHGSPVVHDDDAWKLDLVNQLTDLHESTRQAPWAVSDAPSDYLAAQLRAIVGIEIVVSQIDAKWKMSQNQPDQNRAGVIADLTTSTSSRSRAVGEFMQPLPPKDQNVRPMPGHSSP